MIMEGYQLAHHPARQPRRLPALDDELPPEVREIFVVAATAVRVDALKIGDKVVLPWHQLV